MFVGPFAESMLRRAQDKKLVEIKIHNLRDWSTDKHRSVDDAPYGGGAGMVMRVDIIDRAVMSLKTKATQVILLDTKGEIYTQKRAQNLAKKKHLILIAGHYEGVDHRVHEHIADDVISIGPYVLTGGELPVMVVVDSVIRLLPGVINPESLKEESYSSLLKAKTCLPARQGPKLSANVEYPQYTRPPEYKGWKVPQILLSGNHREITKWHQEKSKKQSSIVIS